MTVSWITLLWAMVSAACLTLAAVHLPLWLRDRSAWPSFFFSLLCVANACLALSEMQMLHARTPDAYAAAMRLAHVPILAMVVAVVGFISSYFNVGRRWLGYAAIALRTASLLPNFLTGQSLNLSTISSIDRLEFLGERASIAVGTPSPWIALDELSLALLVIFLVDASIGAWRRGARREALTVGGGLLLFSLAGTIQALLVFTGVLRMPITISLFSLAIVIAMAYELSGKLLAANRLAQDLHESRKRMALATEAAEVGTWMFEFGARSLWTNPRARTVFGFSPTEAPDVEALLSRVDTMDLTAVREVFSASQSTSSDCQTEFRIHPGGDTTRVRWVSARGRVELDERGRPQRMRGACNDVTERKEIEKQMVQLRLDVAHAARVSAMGHLATGLAHEINQPLGAIMRNAETALLLLKSPQTDMQEIREVLTDILDDDERAGAVIDRMRAMLRRSEIEFRPLGIDALLSEVAALVRSDAAVRRVRLMTKVADGLPPVWGDPVHLQQVLLNLISNGMDAVEEANPKDRCITISATRGSADIVEFAVSDTGPGIAQDHLEQIFDSFYTTKASGLGMGLAISRSLVEAHGGRLWAENRQGGGSSLRFTLPIAAVERQEA